mgnify:CR=1 FL=1
MGSELQTINGQNKLALWAERVSACRSSDQSVRDWCKASVSRPSTDGGESCTDLPKHGRMALALQK